jgi:hypothetical protein
MNFNKMSRALIFLLNLRKVFPKAQKQTYEFTGIKNETYRA